MPNTRTTENFINVSKLTTNDLINELKSVSSILVVRSNPESDLVVGDYMLSNTKISRSRTLNPPVNVVEAESADSDIATGDSNCAQTTYAQVIGAQTGVGSSTDKNLDGVPGASTGSVDLENTVTGRGRRGTVTSHSLGVVVVHPPLSRPEVG